MFGRRSPRKRPRLGQTNTGTSLTEEELEEIEQEAIEKYKRTKERDWKGFMALAETAFMLLAFVFLIGYIMVLLSSNSSSAYAPINANWERYIILLAGIQTITFTAVGWLFGKEVNREQAQSARQDAKEANQQASEVRANAILTSQKAEEKVARIAQASTQMQAKVISSVVQAQAQTAKLVQQKVETELLNTPRALNVDVLQIIQSIVNEMTQANLEQLVSLTKELSVDSILFQSDNNTTTPSNHAPPPSNNDKINDTPMADSVPPSANDEGLKKHI